jgi:hypothetical protein
MLEENKKKDLLITSLISFLTRGAENDLLVHGGTTQLCAEKKFANVRKFRARSLFHLQIVKIYRYTLVNLM